MKIIHVLSCLSKGGGERVVVELANKGIENGDEITIVAGWPVDAALLQNHLDQNIKIRFVAKTKRGAYVNMLPWIFKNKKWLSNNDVLHCHLTYGSLFGALAKVVVKKISGKKYPIIVETNHAVGMPVPKFNRWLHSRMAILHDGMALMARDPYWDNFITKNPNLKTGFIPNGISALQLEEDPILKERSRKELGLNDNSRYVVGTVSMLRPDRQPRLYIPIFYDIYKALGDEVQFILAGAGSELDHIKNDIRELGLIKQVHMPGLVANPVIPISNMDVYVSISVGESAGISMIEAAMCKVPAVGIQMVENYHAKPGDWVWSHTDIKEVAKKIIFLLQHPEERKKLAEAQNKYVNDNFTAERMYSSYVNFYKKFSP